MEAVVFSTVKQVVFAYQSINLAHDRLVSDGSSRIFNIASTSTIRFTGDLTFADGVVAGANGGAVYAAAGANLNWTIDSGVTLRFENNSASQHGGAIWAAADFIQGGEEKILFDSNVACCYGGAIYSGGTVQLGNHAEFTSNTGGTRGGGIYAYTAVTLGNHAIFTGNEADDGGAIYVDNDGTLTIGTDAVFTGNRADTNTARAGGAIEAAGTANFEIGDRATFTGNMAGQAGAIRADALTLGDNATFTGNTAVGIAGAIRVMNGLLDIGTDAVFTDNAAGYGGGAIVADSTAIVSLRSNTWFTDNRAGGDGGAIFANGTNIYDYIVDIGGNTFFENNRSGGAGGAIFVDGGFDIDNRVSIRLAGGADIVFDGNEHGMSDINTLGTGERNSIFLEKNTYLSLQSDGNIYFNDPIDSGSDGGNILFYGPGASPDAFVQFLGANVLNTTGVTGNSVDIVGGEFRLATDFADTSVLATFNASGGGNFHVGNNGRLADTGTITADNFIIDGTLSPDRLFYESPDWDPVTQTFGATKTPTGIAFGTLTLASGNVTFAAGSVYEYDFIASSGYNDVLDVSEITIVSGASDYFASDGGCSPCERAGDCVAVPV